jgi:putative ABC transport system permease protein
LNVQAPVRVPAAQRPAFYADVLEAVESLPGVQSAGLIGDLFITNDDEHVITVADHPDPPLGPIRIRHDEASPDIFKTLGATLLRGRPFSNDDRPDGPHVAVVNEAMAHRLWPGQDPIGRQFKMGPATPWFTVVGFVRDMRREGLEIEPIPQMFEPLAQNPSRNEVLLVRTATTDPLQMASSVQAAVRRVDAQTPMYFVNTLDRLRAASLAQRRFQITLLVGFSAVALLLAALGVYGLLRYAVTTRTREIGIRMAVGAQPRDIVQMVVRQGMQLSVAGVIVGLAGAWLAGRAASGLLFGVSPVDPLVLVFTSVVVVSTAAAACCLPARRAARVSPATALRDA